MGRNRGTVRKGQKELENGPMKDRFSDRGCKKSEELLSNLPEDIKKIGLIFRSADLQIQTD
ncbi:MAG: hypothetical protein D3904_10010 [Candidatus Electrothrix sp. EH2]|nr:hypothetical protein [Candidatus Electrothrix sp. EH2]